MQCVRSNPLYLFVTALSSEAESGPICYLHGGYSGFARLNPELCRLNTTSRRSLTLQVSCRLWRALGMQIYLSDLEMSEEVRKGRGSRVRVLYHALLRSCSSCSNSDLAWLHSSLYCSQTVNPIMDLRETRIFAHQPSTRPIYSRRRHLKCFLSFYSEVKRMQITVHFLRSWASRPS